MAHALPEPGDLIAEKYVVRGLLGQGGMGAVYVVEHRVTGKRLALKCLLPEHAEHADRVERFLREAQAAGRIQHRHVVDVFDVGQDGRLLFIVMELLEGHPLSDLMRGGHLTLDDTLVILLRAMHGVAAAHAQGIIHRDLKPDNIFVCEGPSGRLDDPRVLDFGISKFEEARTLTLTQTGVMMGTPHYMAFEQLNSQRDLDQRVDVYAMGVIAYEALSGTLPYVAESVGALAIQMMSSDPSILDVCRSDLPPGLSDVVMRAMSKDRDARFPSMLAFIEALAPYVSADRSVSPLPPGPELGAPAREPSAVPAMAFSGSRIRTPLSPAAGLRLAADEEEYPAKQRERQPGGWMLKLAVMGLLGVVAAGVWSYAQGGGQEAPSEEPGGGAAAAPSTVSSPRTVGAVAPARTPPQRQPQRASPKPEPQRASPKPATITSAPERPEGSAQQEQAAVRPGPEAAPAGAAQPRPHPGRSKPRPSAAAKKAAPPEPPRTGTPPQTWVDMVPQAPPVPAEEREPEGSSPTEPEGPAGAAPSPAPEADQDPAAVISDQLPARRPEPAADPAPAAEPDAGSAAPVAPH